MSVYTSRVVCVGVKTLYTINKQNMPPAQCLLITCSGKAHIQQGINHKGVWLILKPFPITSQLWLILKPFPIT